MYTILEPQPSEELCRHLIQQRKFSLLQSQVGINNVEKVQKVQVMLQTVTVHRHFRTTRLLSPLRFQHFYITMKMNGFQDKTKCLEQPSTIGPVWRSESPLVSQQRVVSKCKYTKESLSLIRVQL